MRGTSTSALIIVATVVAVATLAGLAVLRMGEAAVGGVSASVTLSELSEQEGVVTATIEVLRGSLAGVAIRYAMPNGSAWWAKPIYCVAVNNTAEVTPTTAYFSRPVTAGEAVTCAFYVWAPSTGTYDLWVIGYRPNGTGSVVLTQWRMSLLATPPSREQPLQFRQCGPANATWHELPRVPLQPYVYNFTLIPITWCGQGVVKVKVTWGYTISGYYHYISGSGAPADGLYISLFVPHDYTELVATGSIYWLAAPFSVCVYDKTCLFLQGGPNWVPAGSSLQLFVQFDPYVEIASRPFIRFIGLAGGIMFAVMNAAGGTGTVEPAGFNPSMYWPTNTWTTYVVYNSTSNTLYVKWIVPDVFDVEYTYDLNTFGGGSYRFTPPPSGQYYIVVGVVSGTSYANWQVYSIEYSVS